MRGVLIDIDGVLTVSWRPLPGAVDALAWLRRTGHPLKLVTNTTSRSRRWIADTLADAGFDVGIDDVVTAPVATAAYVAEHFAGARCLVLNSGDIGEDLAGLDVVTDGTPDVVLVGGAGPEFSYDALNTAFRHVQRGARLVAMQRNLFWRTDSGLQLDTGAFLAGLERAAKVEADVVGKPAASFFASALRLIDVAAEDAMMVGDDIESDVLAAQRAGLTGVLVKTGKYLPETHARADGTPDHVIDSFADLPDLLRGG
ncbi:TIGR01458 family HAD-type hydrolase [Haloechinothrix halophila]|uniref:TIGR01458 family HAD-type hydrolase n=1 Tax=Haloechinothrix halophila TaxID=1069073 RepID=UPI0003F70800|nr:TIGR01458 family HAD-type hydrolase [Haloechinothrix halophila]